MFGIRELLILSLRYSEIGKRGRGGEGGRERERDREREREREREKEMRNVIVLAPYRRDTKKCC